MRALVLATLVGACSGSTTGQACALDSDCGTDVCALTDECEAPSDVRTIVLTWTVSGAAASDASCGTHPELFIQFDSSSYRDQTPGFDDVACRQGHFTVFKVPTRYQQVELGVEGGMGDVATIDANGQASFNLVP